MDKQTYYVSIVLGRIAEQPHDHTYQFRIRADEVEAAILQEKLDEMENSQLWVGVLSLVQNETRTMDKRDITDHKLKEIYEMVASLEEKPVENDPTSAKNLGKLLD